ncbi:hypothetical protein CAPTEDRAFT_228543 [Capitella teleta]|uniref:IkappaB kinase n=1 Tax=Capitella teleta TaxID=283909 RepID=R7UTY0_CAPTE|nr:hypothetical protein CAPTEDRAFT_228543 [Capitella teleta]|eukprot:ELU06861.1 hypothetical protein CAPTEDRAFT_228543 [Capitella teleta]
MAEAKQKGDWVCEKTLGRGGFGVVELWHNEATDKRLALKRWVKPGEISAITKKRWVKECKMMQELEHDNIVKAFPVPTALQDERAQLPSLAMEFCAHGSLRYLLSRPENCCGLREKEAHAMTRDIALAIQYLHERDIVHRDIKPENIVIQENEAKKPTFKLIDLGYAKDLDQESLAKSFVGTLLYLAPELFKQTNYTKTVDYWSFGTTVFECLVGFRPFLHSISPAKWVSIICKKSNTEIYAYFDKREVVFSSEIPKPNYLCSVVQSYYENFLQSLLIWDPEVRGGMLPNEKTPQCFQMLHNFLAIKEYFYPILKHDTKLRELQTLIEKDSNVPVSSQILLTNAGPSVNLDGAAIEYCRSWEEDDIRIYLFSDVDLKRDPEELVPTNLVLTMITTDHSFSLFHEQKRAWGHGIHFLYLLTTHAELLSSATTALSNHLMEGSREFQKAKALMVTTKGELKANLEFFMQSVEFDITQLNNKKSQAVDQTFINELSSEEWISARDDIETCSTQLIDKVEKVEKNCRILDAQVMRVLRSPTVKDSSQVFQGLYTQALDMYNDLRRTPKENQKSALDNSNMNELMRNSNELWDQRSRLLSTQIWNLVQCLKNLRNLRDEIQNLRPELLQAKREILQHQRKRQQDLWGMLNFSQQPLSSYNLQYQALSSPESEPSMFQSQVVLSLEASNKIITESIHEKHRLKSAMAEPIVSPVRDLDWSFLDELK